MDTGAAAAAIQRPAATIRNWAYRGLIRQYGKDGSRRALYDLADIYQIAGKFPRRKVNEQHMDIR